MKMGILVFMLIGVTTLAQEKPDGYWFLAKDDMKFGTAPQAFGPYPSEEMCKAAAHIMIPGDREFWTVKHAEEMDRLAIIWAKNEAELRDKLEGEAIAKALKDKKRSPDAPVWVPNGDGCSNYTIYIDSSGKKRDRDWKNGEGSAGSSGCSYISNGPQWSTVLGCRRIKR